MIFSSLSKYMLKYQKAKAKLVEYDVAHEDYPRFKHACLFYDIYSFKIC